MRRKMLRKVFLLIVSLAAMTGPVAAQTKVVVSIKPLHALVAAVMGGIGSPDLLVKGAASPHTYAMKPSDAKALNDADVFFRMSEAVEPFTAKVVRALPKRVEVVTLQDAPGLKLLPRRTGNTFETHAHGGGKGAHKHGHSHTHGKDGKLDSADGHAWLDPDNAKVMVARIEQALSVKYPADAAAFKTNAQKLSAALDTLAKDLEAALKPVAAKPYIVFHDAFQYLEARYGLSAVGSISISPDVPPSAKRLAELRKKVVSLAATCVFAEPQFDTRLVQNLTEGTSARTGTLDPEGSRLDPGPDLYFALMRRLADDIKQCLSPPA
jgi:zinc transport system substrate-binding protein